MECNPQHFYEQIDDYIEPVEHPLEEEGTEKRKVSVKRKPTLPPRNKSAMQATITKVSHGTRKTYKLLQVYKKLTSFSTTF